MEVKTERGETHMNKNLIIAIVLGVLVLISIVQIVQMAELKSNLASGIAIASASPTQSQGANQIPSAPSGAGAPVMVGGC